MSSQIGAGVAAVTDLAAARSRHMTGLAAASAGPAVEDVERWLVTGEDKLVRHVCDPGVDLAQPSLLPGWSRRHVVAHLLGHARALGNLGKWASTGVETRCTHHRPHGPSRSTMMLNAPTSGWSKP